jgi:hypothetical protein
MSSNREPIFQYDPACPGRNGMIANPARDLSTWGSENDTLGAVYCRSLLDRRIPGRSTELALGHLPPWAQPAWIQRLTL